MTLTLEDADVMIEAAERHGVQLLVNVKHSFDPYIVKLREMVERGVGPVAHAQLLVFQRLALTTDCRRTQPQPGRWGHLAARATSVRSLAHHRWGVVRSVRAMTGLWDEGRPVVGCHAAYLEFADGTAATAVYSGYDHFNSEADLRGRRGTTSGGAVGLCPGAPDAAAAREWRCGNGSQAGPKIRRGETWCRRCAQALCWMGPRWAAHRDFRQGGRAIDPWQSRCLW